MEESDEWNSVVANNEENLIVFKIYFTYQLLINKTKIKERQVKNGVNEEELISCLPGFKNSFFKTNCQALSISQNIVT